MKKNIVIGGIIFAIALWVIGSFLIFDGETEVREDMDSRLRGNDITKNEEVLKLSIDNQVVQDDSDSDTGGEFSAPMERADERVTVKPFGIFIEPVSAPVQPERFRGYHAGTDFEILAGEEDVSVPFFAICSGEIVLKKFVNGYGGVVIQECMYEGESVTVLYGHVALESIAYEVSEDVSAGEQLGILGKGFSSETDGERKHLHLSIYKGDGVDFRGYANVQSALQQWQDPCDLVCEK